MNPFAKTREEVITSMCYTWDHAYGLPKDSFGQGYTDQERMSLWRQMAQIFDNDIYPNLEFRDNTID